MHNRHTLKPHSGCTGEHQSKCIVHAGVRVDYDRLACNREDGMKGKERGCLRPPVHYRLNIVGLSRLELLQFHFRGDNIRSGHPRMSSLTLTCDGEHVGELIGPQVYQQ